VALRGIISQRKKYSLQDTIIVAGSPRSGTTWLTKVLGSTREYSIISEPLHPARFPEAVRSGFSARTYRPAGETWVTGEEYLKRVFTGKISSSRFAGMEDFTSAILSDKLVVKFIRATRLLPWLSEKFDVRQIILLIRHPCAVVASQSRSGYSGYNNLLSGRDVGPGKEEILNEAREIDSVDETIIKKIERITTPEELLATAWCIDNYVPLTSTQKHKWLLAPYEKLTMNSPGSIKEIADMCGIVFSRKNLKNITTPSRTASNDLKISDIRQLSKWKDHLSKEQIAKILNIVSAFGLDFYNDAIFPDYERLGEKGTKVV